MATKKQNDLGIGVDIEEIRRFKKLDIFKNGSFLRKIYTKKELAYCLKKANPHAHLAGRFVAKEAVFKALSVMGRGRGILLNKIEILSNKNNAPQVVIHGTKGDDLHINLSISHSQSSAIAFAFVVRYEKSKKKNSSK